MLGTNICHGPGVLAFGRGSALKGGAGGSSEKSGRKKVEQIPGMFYFTGNVGIVLVWLRRLVARTSQWKKEKSALLLMGKERDVGVLGSTTLTLEETRQSGWC